MKVTALCFRLLMLHFTLLSARVQNSHAQKSDAVFLRIVPNRLQHFQREPVTFHCEGSDGFTQLRGTRNTEEYKPECETKRTPTGSSCTIDRVNVVDGGEYWCETKGGERSNRLNITVTAGSVILDGPLLPVLEGQNVTLSCRNKMTSSNLVADFYKDGLCLGNSSTGQMTIHSVSKSDEGLYKCNISDVGESPESWLTVRAGSVILDGPLLPVLEGQNVTLSCRNKMTSSNHEADFYKDGLFLGRYSTGQMIIHSVSKSDEGLYKCKISDGRESPESWLPVRALCRISDHSFYVLLILRTVFTILMVALLLPLVGLLHCGKLTVTQK